MCADDTARKTFEGTTNHGRAVFRRLTEPWTETRQMVLADSYFASVETSEQLMKTGLRFVVQLCTTATPGRCEPNGRAGATVASERTRARRGVP